MSFVMAIAGFAGLLGCGGTPEPTITVLAATPQIIKSGQSAILNVAVSSESYVPTGTVVLQDGNTPVASVDLVAGQATVATPALASGLHALQASYNGTTIWAASTSGSVPVTSVAPPAVSCAPTSSAVFPGLTVPIKVSATSVRPLSYSVTSTAGQIAQDQATALLNTNGLSPQVVRITCNATDDLGQTTSAATALTIQSATGEQALSAYSFVDSVGVNVHLHYPDTPYVYAFPQLLQSMKALGIKHYRNGIDPWAYPWEYTNAEALAANGMKADWLIDARDTAANINAIYANAPDSVEAFEGPNEDDALAGYAETNFMNMLYSTVKSNPGTRNAQVYGPTFTQLSSVTTQGPTLAANSDAASMHDYYIPRYPETPGYGSSFFGCGAYGSMSFNACIAGVDTPGKPVVSTETGYTSGQISDETIGKYTTRTLFDHLRANVMRTYLYEFIDEVSSPGFGLVRADFTPKPAYVGIRNLINLFADVPFSTPGRLDLSISGNTLNVNHLTFQRSDGTWMVAFWLGAVSGNGGWPYQDYTVPWQQITVSTATPFSASQFYTLDREGGMGSWPITNNGGTMTLYISDMVSVLELSPPH